MPILPSINKVLLILAKNHAETDIKAVWSFPLWLDFFILCHYIFLGLSV